LAGEKNIRFQDGPNIIWWLTANTTVLNIKGIVLLFFYDEPKRALAL
jgi:hypothetical protein